MFAHIANILLLVLLPMVVINVKGNDFSLSKLTLRTLVEYDYSDVVCVLVGATVVCFTYSILFLKLWSYVQVNLWCRNKSRFARTLVSKRLRRQSLSVGQFLHMGGAQGMSVS